MISISNKYMYLVALISCIIYVILYYIKCRTKPNPWEAFTVVGSVLFAFPSGILVWNMCFAENLNFGSYTGSETAIFTGGLTVLVASVIAYITSFWKIYKGSNVKSL